jgi:hypothetical protein
MLRKDNICEFSASYKVAIFGNDIVANFDGNKLCDDAVILFFSKCLMDDDKSFRSERIGHRVFLALSITVREDSTYNFLFFAFVSSDSSF